MLERRNKASHNWKSASGDLWEKMKTWMREGRGSERRERKRDEMPLAARRKEWEKSASRSLLGLLRLFFGPSIAYFPVRKGASDSAQMFFALYPTILFPKSCTPLPRPPPSSSFLLLLFTDLSTFRVRRPRPSLHIRQIFFRGFHRS